MSEQNPWTARGRRSLGRPLAAAALAVVLGGCASSPDPHDGGFVSGVIGLAGGGYQRRVDDRTATYQGELDAQTRLKAEARALEQERDAVRGELGRAQARLAEQERRIAAERARIAAARQRSAADQARLARLDQAQSRVASTRAAVRAVDPSAQPVPDLKARTADIKGDLAEIDDLVGVVAGPGF